MSVPHFITLWRYCILLEIKVYGNFASSKSIGTIFPTAFAHFMSLFHILVILEMFQTFALFVIFVELPWWLRWLRICLNAGDLNSIPGLGRSSGEGNGHPLQYSCLGNPMDRGILQVTVHGVAEEAGSIPGSGRSPGEGNGNTLQHSCLGNPKDRGAWQATVHGVA